MPLPDYFHIEDFLRNLTQKRYSSHTILAYCTDLQAFFDFILVEYPATSLPEISASMVRTWLASLKDKGESSRTINRKVSSLKAFFKYQLKLERIKVSPVAAIGSLKVSRKLPSFLEEKEADNLFENIEFPDTWEGKLDYLILEILYQTGIRRSELISLAESNVDTRNGTIKVVGKGNKERILPVNNRLLRRINDYIEEKRKLFGTANNTCLLVNAKGRFLYPKYVYNCSKKYLKQVSTLKKRGPHTLRHSFATHLTNNGAQISAIKELLGHSSLAATQIYTHNSIEKLKEVHKQAHPRS